jgi:hypothetical protein
MNNIWKKRYSGKIEFIIIFLFVVALLLCLIALRVRQKAKFDGEELDFIQICIGFFLTFSPLTIPFTLYPIVCILRKRVPKKIVIDEENENLTIDISRKNVKQISFENLGYAVKGTNLYSTLIIYEKVLIRGMIYDTTLHEESQYFYKRVIDFEALALTLSWNINDLNAISTRFDELNISKINPTTKKPFLLRLLEK